MLKEDSKWYFYFLMIFLCFNDIFDSYSTNFPNSVMHEVIDYFPITESTYLLAIGIASIGMYFVFFNQYLADLFGRRLLLFITLLGIGITSIFISISQNFIQYIISLFFLYIFFSSDIWQIYLSEQSSEKHRGKLISLVLVFGAVGGALTIPIFRALLLPSFGWRAMTWFAFIAIPIAFLIFLFKEPKVFKLNKKKITNKSKQVNIIDNLKKIFDKRILKSTITIALLGFAIGFNYVFLLSGEQFLVEYRSLSSSEVDFVILILGFGAILGYILAGVISDYIGRKPVIYIFSILGAPGILMLIFGDYLFIILGAFIVSVAYWALFVTSRTIAYEIYPTDIRGTGAGFRSLCYALGVTLGSISTAFTLIYIGLGWSYLLNSILLIIMLPLVILFIKETKGIKLDTIELI